MQSPVSLTTEEIQDLAVRNATWIFIEAAEPRRDFVVLPYVPKSKLIITVCAAYYRISPAPGLCANKNDYKGCSAYGKMERSLTSSSYRWKGGRYYSVLHSHLSYLLLGKRKLPQCQSDQSCLYCILCPRRLLTFQTALTLHEVQDEHSVDLCIVQESHVVP